MREKIKEIGVFELLGKGLIGFFMCTVPQTLCLSKVKIFKQASLQTTVREELKFN